MAEHNQLHAPGFYPTALYPSRLSRPRSYSPVYGPDSSPPVHLIQPEGVRDELSRRLQQEIADLERRVITLQGAGSPGSGAIITTYERMIENKRQFIAELDQ